MSPPKNHLWSYESINSRELQFVLKTVIDAASYLLSDHFPLLSCWDNPNFIRAAMAFLGIDTNFPSQIGGHMTCFWPIRWYNKDRSSWYYLYLLFSVCGLEQYICDSWNCNSYLGPWRKEWKITEVPFLPWLRYWTNACSCYLQLLVMSQK